MRTPKTKTLLWLAVGLLVLCAVWIPNYYPAPIPVLGSDGTPLLKPDGSPVVHRDMTEFYRYNRPAFILLVCSICLFGWWLVRVGRGLCERKTASMRRYEKWRQETLPPAAQPKPKSFGGTGRPSERRAAWLPSGGRVTTGLGS